jgi:hypothetical protein
MALVRLLPPSFYDCTSLGMAMFVFIGLGVPIYLSLFLLGFFIGLVLFVVLVILTIGFVFLRG